MFNPCNKSPTCHQQSMRKLASEKVGSKDARGAMRGTGPGARREVKLPTFGFRDTISLKERKKERRGDLHGLTRKGRQSIYISKPPRFAIFEFLEFLGNFEKVF